MSANNNLEAVAARNRANAAHSTGPRTPQGKAISSRNATSHGLCAATVVVHDWESQIEFDRLRDEYLRRFRPIDRVERDLVDRLVDSTWRRTRAISIETTLLDLESDAIEGDTRANFQHHDDGLLRVTLAYRERHSRENVWEAIQRHIAAIERSYKRAFSELRALQGPERFNKMPVVQNEAAEDEEFEAELEEEFPQYHSRTHFRHSLIAMGLPELGATPLKGQKNDEDSGQNQLEPAA